MISTASIQAAVDVVLKFAADVAALEAAVTRLEQAERSRMQQLQLALWSHAGVKPNGHHRSVT
jgi:hypothetical protein